MMQRRRFRRRAYGFGKILSPAIEVGVIGFGVVMSVESKIYSNWPHVVAKIIFWLQHFSFPIWLALGLLALVGWTMRWSGDPWIWDKLQALLDEFQEVAYSNFKDHIKDDHRVTLFKYQKWNWSLQTPMTESRWPWKKGRLPWNGWLVPVLRSGITSQKTRAIFMVPDNGNHAEGVAGRAWTSNQMVTAEKLPSLTTASAEYRIKSYADRTFCPQAIVRDYITRNRPLPLSIGAIPIEVNNVRWGVLVLDSRDPEGVTSEMLNNQTLIVRSISQLLERAK